MKKIILLKILLNTNLKIILLDYQNNLVGTLKIISNVINNFDILTISRTLNYIIILIIQNYFSDLYPVS